MAVSVSKNVLTSMGISVGDSYPYGALNIGDSVSFKGRRYTLSANTLASDDTLDRFLESITGLQIDFFSSVGRLKYAMVRDHNAFSLTGNIRVFDGYGALLSSVSPAAYQEPDQNAILDVYSRRLSQCSYEYYCTSRVQSDYFSLITSANNYASSYNDFDWRFQEMLGDFLVTTWDVEAYLSSAQSYTAKEADFISRYNAFVSGTLPTPVPQVPVPQKPVPQVPVPQKPVPQVPVPQKPAPQQPPPNSDNDG